MFKKIIKKIERKNENINILIKTIFTIWIFVFILSAMAFAGFTTKLDTAGEATIQKHIYDYVYINHVEVSDSSGGSSLYYSFKDHELKSTNITQTCNNYVTYALTIVNTTPYKAFITNSTVKSMINGAGNNTTSETIEFTDVTLNSTYIEPHSTKTVHLKIMNNCTGTDDQVTSIVEFEYSLYKYFDLTVVSDQSDSNISMTTQEGTFTETGSITHRVYEGDTATYKVSKHHYYDSTGNYKMGQEDHTINVTMTPDPKRDVTVNVTGINVPPTTVTIKDSSSNTITPQSGTTYILNKGETYTYTVQNVEYYDKTGTYTVGEPDGQVINVAFTNDDMRPWITGTTTNTVRTTAATKTETNYHPGYYLVEAWGGKGGNGGGNRGGTSGSIGNVYGVVYISAPITIFATAGGNGATGQRVAGGANGGGTSGNESTNQKSSSGGGYSAFSVGTTSITLANCQNSSVKLIAGGSGGGAGAGGELGTFSGGNGGSGGTYSSESASVTGGTAYRGADGTNKATGIYAQGEGGGGFTSAGAAGGGKPAVGSGAYASPGDFGIGGQAEARGGAGGAGYYGGGGGHGYHAPLSGADFGPGGGGGGSSFKASDVSTTIPSGFSLGSNSSSTGGSVKITWIGYQL